MSIRLRNPLKMLRSKAIALDIGSGQTLIAATDGTILLDEPTVIALEQGNAAAIATGTEAKSYIGKAPDRIRVARPVEYGGIVDFEAARELLKRFLARVAPTDGTRIKACVVSAQGLTELERRTLTDCCKAAGVTHVDLLGAPLAAAIGAGLDIRQPKGLLLLGIGAGLAEASVLSLSDVVCSQTAKCGALAFHEAVSRHLSVSRQVYVGENMAEQVTIQLACATPGDGERVMTVTGKNTANGAPCTLELTQADLDGALATVLDELEALVRGLMERAPAELVADIGDSGLLLYGGGAQLYGLAACLSQRLKLRTVLAQEPRLASIWGAAAALRPDLEYRKLLRR